MPLPPPHRSLLSHPHSHSVAALMGDQIKATTAPYAIWPRCVNSVVVTAVCRFHETRRLTSASLQLRLGTLLMLSPQIAHWQVTLGLCMSPWETKAFIPFQHLTTIAFQSLYKGSWLHLHIVPLFVVQTNRQNVEKEVRDIQKRSLLITQLWTLCIMCGKQKGIRTTCSQ